MQYRRFGETGTTVSALGFGTMRLPLNSDDPADVDRPESIRMIRHAVDQGVNYIDTAYPYHGGRSEGVVGVALKGGYRDRVMLATKLPIWMVESADDVDRLLDEQLERLDDSFIDVYLIHNLARTTWPLVARHQVLERLERARGRGLIGKIGFSFHDSVELFKEIVDAYDGWSVAQIQYNYANEKVQAGTEGLEYGAGRGIAMVIMEPLLGGCLVNPPPAVAAVFRGAHPERTPADWALQWLWDKPEVGVVLSGMSAMQHVSENLDSAERSGIGSLCAEEKRVITEAAAAYKGAFPIPCTACRYCMPCPHGVDIPAVFGLYNGVKAFQGNQGLLNRIIYQNHLVDDHAGLCQACGVCLDKCPQKIDIMSWMPTVHEAMSQPPAPGA